MSYGVHAIYTKLIKAENTCTFAKTPHCYISTKKPEFLSNNPPRSPAIIMDDHYVTFTFDP